MTLTDKGLKPLAAPFYAQPYTPEWHCKGFRRISVMCEVEPAAIRELLTNTPFQPTGTKIEFFIDDMSGHSLGSFNESGMLVPVEYGGVKGLYHPAIFITTDVAMIAGREVFGYPKILGDVSFEKNNSGFSGATARNGQDLFSIEFTPQGQPEVLSQLTTLSDNWNRDEYEWTHHLLVKSIPSPFKEQPDVFSVIYRNLSATLTCIQPGHGILKVGTAREVSPVQGAKVVASYYLEGDFGAGFQEDRRILSSI